MDSLDPTSTATPPPETQDHTVPPPPIGGGEEETTGRRRRRSRWDPPPSDSAPGNQLSGDATGGNIGNTGSRALKRKSRWSDDEPKSVIRLPDFMTDFPGGVEIDPETLPWNARLLEINRMLQLGMPLDDRPEGERSPSPEPIYDNAGFRINTREYRARERLNRERQEIISQIIKKNPAFKPPADYRPPKLRKKLYIPVKEYPGYGFIGLIIGPRGEEHKKMEKDTRAKIVIRGKGSVKEGRLQRKRDLKPDPSENEDLHVLVEAETQKALDDAVERVEKLLQPVADNLNELKRQQLRKLAALNGTIRDEEFCRLCGEHGHRQYACPSRNTTFKSDVLCTICGDGGHPTIDCPLKDTSTTGKKMDDEYQNFLAELGGTMHESAVKQSATLSLGPGSSGSNPPRAGNTGGLGSANQSGLGANVLKPTKEIDNTNLYIGYLPPNLDDDGLIGLFSGFGDIVMAKVIKDRVTGLSKGYGFVKYHDIQMANNAIASMNGYRLQGRTIAVRVAGKPPEATVPPGPPTSTMPSYPVAGQSVGACLSQQFMHGPLPNAPPSSYTGASAGYTVTPVPWGPPAPPPFVLYAPPPPGSTLYPPLVPGQLLPSYMVQYPPPMLTAASGAPTQTVTSSESQPSYPSGVHSENSSCAPPVPSAQPACATTPIDYSSYCSAAPPSPPLAPTIDHSQGARNMPWAPNQPLPPSVSSAAEKASYGADTEYEKFMAEMK